MSIKQVQVAANEITLGMFVSGLDRPWTQTPFPLQGFLVRSPDDIDTLRTYCDYVYIDITKGRVPAGADPAKFTRTKPARRDQHLAGSASLAAAGKVPSPFAVKPDVYKTVTPLRKELVNANRVLVTLKGNMTLFARQLAKGRPIDYQSLKLSADSMVDSVLRCPDAFTWLLRLRGKDQQTYDHSLRSALWAVQFARYIGMSKDAIQVLCTATLLKDIGKLRLPQELLHKPDRSEEEEAQYRRFVDYSVEMLLNTHQVEPKVISVVRHHCERFDGSGFPQKLVGSKIPVLAQICGIASTYDAVSNPYESSKPLASSRAVSLLYNMRDQLFREDLVLQFIQSVGVYPTGTLVELTTGDIGVVVEQDPKSRLTPQVSVLSPKKNKGNIVIDLKNESDARDILFNAGSYRAHKVPKLAIARDLEPSCMDLAIEEISPDFVSRTQETKTGLLATLKNYLTRS